MHILLTHILSNDNDLSNDLSFGIVSEYNFIYLLEKRMYDAFEQKILSLPPEQLTLVLDEICRPEKYDRLLTSLLLAQQSELSRLMSGIYSTNIAWQKRSAARARELSQSQIQAFFAHLDEAYTALDFSFSEPLLADEALSRLIRVYMGMSEKEEAERCFTECIARNPTHLGACLNYFRCLLPRWLGSWPEIEALFTRFPADTASGNFLRLLYLAEKAEETTGPLLLPVPLKKILFILQYRKTCIETFVAYPIKGKELYSHAHMISCRAFLAGFIGKLIERRQLLSSISYNMIYYPWASWGITSPNMLKISLVIGAV